MKPTVLTTVFLFLCGAAIGILVYREFRKPVVSDPQQITLEQILYIKELHLVEHTYNDLFFLHRKNNKVKAIRAMAQVPVTISAYINLKEIQLVKQNDSIRQVILPHAQLNEPHYDIDQMIVRETRSFQLYAGKDQYPQVTAYIKDIVAERKALVRSMAISNRIIIQAEAEGKQYIEHVLALFGHKDVIVTFGDTVKDNEVKDFEKAMHAPTAAPASPIHPAALSQIPFGFLAPGQ